MVLALTKQLSQLILGTSSEFGIHVLGQPGISYSRKAVWDERALWLLY